MSWTPEFNKAEAAQRQLDREIDQVAANIIVKRGVSFGEALAEAKEIIRCRRTGQRRVIPMTIRHFSYELPQP